ncbi:ABC transporter transmembrane domain-containing protein [Hymenobacter cellulosivorans]|uniref:ABC transporter transmembrane domain-containing protein n=1 Tax=Hymenobacter cellulosivorans TaxID=2932249 RepID=A0ABY4FA75_9BACT|nr:ABC transporter transmembrane domain-containing protein [Hymenobacter cellulosivorans]UOQ51341.1 ABC transporter transmembrane domain-containing protein [Hymenobacter cellulosivorans]
MASKQLALPPPTPWQRLTRMLEPERRSIRYILFYAIATGLISLTLPLGTQAVFNLVSTGAVFGSTYILISVVVLGVLLAGLLLIGQFTLVEAMEQRLFAKAAIEYAYRLPRIDPKALEGENPPELVNRFFDILTVQKGLTKLLIDLMFAGIQILFGVIVLSFYHPVFVGLGLTILVLLGLIYFMNYRRALRTSIEESAHKYEAVEWLEKVAGTLPSYRNNPTAQQQVLDHTDELTAQYLRARNSHFSVLKSYYGWGIALRTLLTGGLLIAGTLFVVSRQMTLGQFVAAEVLIVQISSSIEKLMTGLATVFDMLTGVEKLAAVTDLPLVEEPHSAASHA